MALEHLLRGPGRLEGQRSERRVVHATLWHLKFGARVFLSHFEQQQQLRAYADASDSSSLLFLHNGNK